MGYFGTDGIRGIYGEYLDENLAERTGAALVAYFGKGKYIIARDSRLGGPELEKALTAGLTRGGADVLLCGVIPTPAAAYLTVKHGAVCGIMISASHNPPEYNGIKVFGSDGVKLNAETEAEIERFIDAPPAFTCPRGKVSNLDGAEDDYVDHIVGNFSGDDFSGVSVALDCGYGATCRTAAAAFRRLGMNPTVINGEFCGETINVNCGALYPETLAPHVAGKCDFGFSFDGDGDRVSVLYRGRVVDGDSVLYNLSRSMELSNGAVVGTILNNLALETRLKADGKTFYRTGVGDKYICDLMFKEGYNLGGEQSGHFIVYPYGTTGDGIMAALLFIKSLLTGGAVREPVILELYPQDAIAEYADRSILDDPAFKALQAKHEVLMAGTGRIIARYSGTEPKVRVMAESSDRAAVDAALRDFKEYIAVFNGGDKK